VAGHELFGEGFARFEARGFGAWAGDGEAAPFKLVCESGGERRFAADNREFDLFRFSKIGEGGDICRTRRDTTRDFSDGVAAGCAEEFKVPAGSFPESMAKRVFAPARANDQNLHRREKTVTFRKSILFERMDAGMARK
jgi:hypothetical protein